VLEGSGPAVQTGITTGNDLLILVTGVLGDLARREACTGLHGASADLCLHGMGDCHDALTHAIPSMSPLLQRARTGGCHGHTVACSHSAPAGLGQSSQLSPRSGRRSRYSPCRIGWCRWWNRICSLCAGDFCQHLLPVVRNTYAGISSVDPDIAGCCSRHRTDMDGRNEGEDSPFAACHLLGSKILLNHRHGVAIITVFIGSGGLGVIVLRGLARFYVPEFSLESFLLLRLP